MENASKALLMAAGVLIAILVVALVVYAFNNMSNTMQNDLTAEQEKQLAEFNTEFASYDRDGLTGFDMISLVNKVIDYNILNADEQGYPRVDVEFSLNERSASILKIDKTYKTDNISDKDFLSGDVDSGLFDENIEQLEQTYGKNELTKLGSRLSDIENPPEGMSRLEVIRDALGKNDVNKLGNIANITNEQIKTYQSYIEFKREENFNCTDVKYENGRIKKLTFEQGE